MEVSTSWRSYWLGVWDPAAGICRPKADIQAQPRARPQSRSQQSGPVNPALGPQKPGRPLGLARGPFIAFNLNTHFEAKPWDPRIACAGRVVNSALNRQGARVHSIFQYLSTRGSHAEPHLSHRMECLNISFLANTTKLAKADIE